MKKNIFAELKLLTPKYKTMNRKLLKLTAFLLILLVALASSCQPDEPKEIEYTILPESLNFEATGGEDGFTVSVKSPAIVESVESLAAWCQVSTNGGSSVNVMVTVDPYTYYEARNTTVVVNMKLGENKTSTTVPITQAGVEIPEWVLIDGIKWATRNVDMPGTFAAKPEDPGMFYQWNRKVGWSATDPMINSNGETTWDSSLSFSSIWEKVNDPCPPGWRLPMFIELESLANAGSLWTTLNGVDGFLFSSDGNLLFLSAAGRRGGNSGGLFDVGTDGWYPCSDASRTILLLSYDKIGIAYMGTPTSGHSIRCVAE